AHSRQVGWPLSEILVVSIESFRPQRASLAVGDGTDTPSPYATGRNPLPLLFVIGRAYERCGYNHRSPGAIFGKGLISITIDTSRPSPSLPMPPMASLHYVNSVGPCRGASTIRPALSYLTAQIVVLVLPIACGFLFGPGIPETNRTVKHRPSRFRIPIQTKITLPLELNGFLPLRIGKRGLHMSPCQHFNRARIEIRCEIFIAAWVRPCE